MTAHRFHPSVLREYDVRGVVGTMLTEADAEAIGRAFGTIVARKGGRKATIGRDGRVSSPGFEAAVAKGLAACGLEVVRIGLGPTPMLYYSVYALGADAGIMVTGSHNPPDQNGFKMMLGPTVPGPSAFYGDDVQSLGRIAAAGDFARGQGRIGERPMLDDYVERLAQEAKLRRPLNVAWDAGNGAAGEALRRLAARLPGRHELLFAEIDGTFPNQHPDPTVAKNLVDLQAAVARGGCDLGVAFDGDGDRLGVVDGRGRIVWADQLMVLFARDVLKRQPGATVIADVKASQVLFDAIARAGGKPLMWKTGHSLIKAKMKELHAPVAGEMSGHLFFAERYHGFDDGLYAAARLLRILSEADFTLADFLDSLPPVVNTPELRFDVAADRKWAVIDEVKARLAATGASPDATDGVRVNGPEGWWLLRASNTQEVLVARCEARDAAGLARLKAALAAQLSASGVTLPAELR